MIRRWKVFRFFLWRNQTCPLPQNYFPGRRHLCIATVAFAGAPGGGGPAAPAGAPWRPRRPPRRLSRRRETRYPARWFLPPPRWHRKRQTRTHRLRRHRRRPRPQTLDGSLHPPRLRQVQKIPRPLRPPRHGRHRGHEWTGLDRDQGNAAVILDNLIADNKIVPMIVVFPKAMPPPIPPANGTQPLVRPGPAAGRGARPPPGRRTTLLHRAPGVLTGTPPPPPRPGPAAPRRGWRAAAVAAMAGGAAFTTDLLKRHHSLHGIPLLRPHRPRTPRPRAASPWAAARPSTSASPTSTQFAWVGAFSHAPNAQPHRTARSRPRRRQQKAQTLLDLLRRQRHHRRPRHPTTSTRPSSRKRSTTSGTLTSVDTS